MFFSVFDGNTLSSVQGNGSGGVKEREEEEEVTIVSRKL